MMTILSLCDFTGEWSRPYVEAGYDVIRVDIKRGGDVRLFKALSYPVRGVLAAPPLYALRQFRRQVVEWQGGISIVGGSGRG